MKVKLDSWLHRGRGKERYNMYSVRVTDIPTRDEDENGDWTVHSGGRSKVEAEIFAEVFQHYIDAFPGAEDRVRQAANSSADGDDVPLVEHGYLVGLEDDDVRALAEWRKLSARTRNGE
jgi:hypothetical protein